MVCVVDRWVGRGDALLSHAAGARTDACALCDRPLMVDTIGG